MATGVRPSSTSGILSPENANKRSDLIELLRTAYWMFGNQIKELYGVTRPKAA